MSSFFLDHACSATITFRTKATHPIALPSENAHRRHLRLKDVSMFRQLAILGLIAALSFVSAPAQTSSSTTSQSQPSNAPVAYVYVVNNPGSGNPNTVYGFSAASNGALTPIPGSPFPQNINSMAVNGKYLIATDYGNPPNLDTFKIGSNGSLTYLTQTSCGQTGNACVAVFNLFFDHTGSDLYAMEYDGSNDNTASFAVDGSTGALSYLGDTITGAFPGDYTDTFFIGNNEYAYSADQSGCMYPNIYGFLRESNGLLNSIEVQFNEPVPPSTFRGYYPDLAVADPNNNLAILEQPVNPPGCAASPLQIAVYTADTSGNLNTNSTYKNMPATAIKSPSDMKMSPDGKTLAVAGIEGAQLFHFNGSNPVTRYTGLLTTEPITQMFWDNSNHIYAISSDGYLYVATVTATKITSAPGSPYKIGGPESLIVQPLTQ
jgi:6-phosphogluconolactonase (cycloisomerase 2 family)